MERKIGRCESCPSTLDPDLYEELKDWRAARAKEQKLPAFCVFTDATLVAIGETRPATRQALGRIAGVGRAKLDRYGDEVLAILESAADAGAGPEPGP